MPELCLFCGYTLILTVDKVFFDAHGLLSSSEKESGEEGDKFITSLDDPADNRFINEVLDLMTQSEKMTQEGMDNQAVKNVMSQQLKFSMKNYLDKNERMVTRMKVNMERSNSKGNSIDLRRGSKE